MADREIIEEYGERLCYEYDPDEDGENITLEGLVNEIIHGFAKCIKEEHKIVSTFSISIESLAKDITILAKEKEEAYIRHLIQEKLNLRLDPYFRAYLGEKNIYISYKDPGE